MNNRQTSTIIQAIVLALLSSCSMMEKAKDTAIVAVSAGAGGAVAGPAGALAAGGAAHAIVDAADSQDDASEAQDKLDDFTQQAIDAAMGEAKKEAADKASEAAAALEWLLTKIGLVALLAGIVWLLIHRKWLKPKQLSKLKSEILG